MRQKIVSAVTSGLVPDLFQNTPAELIALYAWEDKLISVADVIESQKKEYTETALTSAFCYNEKETAGLLRRALYHCGIAKPHMAAAGREGRLQDRGYSKDLGRFL